MSSVQQDIQVTPEPSRAFTVPQFDPAIPSGPKTQTDAEVSLQVPDEQIKDSLNNFLGVPENVHTAFKVKKDPTRAEKITRTCFSHSSVTDDPGRYLGNWDLSYQFLSLQISVLCL